MINPHYKHSELTGKIIGCAMHVHRILGSGFQEVIYQRALAIEMAENGIHFEREKEISVYYKGLHVGSRRADFIVENLISVELKALTITEQVHISQAKGYLKAYNVETGLLINFGTPSLEFKRLFNDKYK
ncbi:GxxExxY protein [Chitinophaga sp. 22321]|uniref:GxxExxY protein n=1 Tax=Chitinophaga hostae TaxID=2831022 RepID=A0ABS5ISY7_9BACT|nr:GxxExxY protein [Chitinophaga hostae]MBS0026073.1 GxxExxY protein [Chitinophaga hostae]